ncbi:MAG: SUF system Fe-S cluster assembly regulator [Burkholderiales bacterium]|nr:SUF system Fe-S cluster assembly regulator [Burkholderiales bacterium]PZN05475.1 MAG: SUF system Fe-S cluster assembly regulator [Pseudomonadota bacterium]
MLRISKLTDYGTLVMTHMAAAPTHQYSANEIAAALGLGTPTVSKVLKALSRHGLVVSVRGARGGYALTRAPELITIADIVDALEEQPFGLTECSATSGLCHHEHGCTIRGNWQRINHIVRNALEGVRLTDMLRRPRPRQPEAPAVVARPLAGPVKPSKIPAPCNKQD